MRRLILLILVIAVMALTACATWKRPTLEEAYPQMYIDPPVSILIWPPVNNTTAVDAREYFSCSLSEAIGLKGYYVLPVESVFRILREEGLYESGNVSYNLASEYPAIFTNLKDHFGADAVLQSTIEKWDKSWFLTSGTLTIQARFELFNTTTGDRIWDYRVTSQVSLGSDNEKFLLAVLESAIKTVVEDYFPHAREANILAFRSGLPYGKYHPEAGTDRLEEIPADKHKYLQLSK